MRTTGTLSEDNRHYTEDNRQKEKITGGQAVRTRVRQTVRTTNFGSG